MKFQISMRETYADFGMLNGMDGSSSQDGSILQYVAVAATTTLAFLLWDYNNSRRTVTNGTMVSNLVSVKERRSIAYVTDGHSILPCKVCLRNENYFTWQNIMIHSSDSKLWKSHKSEDGVESS